MTVVSIRLNEKEEKLFKGYADLTGKTLSELFKTALVEEIEDKLDYEIGLKALESYRKNPVSTPIGDFIEELESEL